MKIVGALPILALIFLTACGGGSSANPVPSTPAPQPSPVVNPTSAPAGSAVLSLLIPTRGVTSPSTSIASVNQVAVQINTVNGVATVPSGVASHTDYTLATGLVCSNPAPCSITIPAPAGTVNYTITAYASSTAIATETQTVTSTGQPGQSFNFTLGGIVKAINLSTPSLTFGTSALVALTTTAVDATGATILDTPFANPVNFTDSDSSGSTGLEFAGGTPSSSLTMTTPANQIFLEYNGGALSSGITSGTVQLINYTTPTYKVTPL
jgi:hypothetical protein